MTHRPVPTRWEVHLTRTGASIVRSSDGPQANMNILLLLLLLFSIPL